MNVFGNSGATGFASALTAAGTTLAEPVAPQRNGNCYFQTRSLTNKSLCLFGGVLLIVAALVASAVAQDGPLEIENEFLAVKWDQNAGRLSIVSKPAMREIVFAGTFNGDESVARVVRLNDRLFGAGQAIEVSHRGGNRDVVVLFPKEPFAIFRPTIRNGGNAGTVVKSMQPLSLRVNLHRGAAELKTFGTAGLLDADKNPGSYAWLAVVEPESRNGVVFGWLSHHRGSGVLFSNVEQDSVRVDARIDYGRLSMAPGEEVELEALAVGYFDDARLGLEAWADTVARVHDVQLQKQPIGYCTWYSRPHGDASDEEHLAELAKFAARELAPYGFSVVQIDDKWQAGVSTNGPTRNFTTHNPNGPYPRGMQPTASYLASLGLTPGIWFMPFAGTSYDPFFKDHRDWFVKREDGQPFETEWGGTCLDMTHPGAREHLRSVADRIVNRWGYRYLKLDGLWTGTATPLRYVNAGYVDDNIGEAVFHDPTKTNVEAYRDGLRLVRAAVGPDVFLLGCNGPQNMRSYGGAMGLVDAMRVGPDNGADWEHIALGPEFGSRHYFLHGRVWYNDPDPVYVRDSMPLHRAQLICSWVALSGQLNLSSDWLPGLSPERLDLLKRSMPSHGLLPRPADLFEHNLPRLWLLTDDRGGARRDVIGAFNWDRQERDFDYPLDKLGLDGDTEYVGFDYWGKELMPAMKGRLRVAVPGESCRILAVRPRASHPQVLSTSQHITQGLVDLSAERWDPTGRTLSGVSNVVANDAYELRIILPADGEWVVEGLHASSADGAAAFAVNKDQPGELLRATIQSPTTRAIAWEIKFKPH